MTPNRLFAVVNNLIINTIWLTLNIASSVAHKISIIMRMYSMYNSSLDVKANIFFLSMLPVSLTSTMDSKGLSMVIATGPNGT